MGFDQRQDPGAKPGAFTQGPGKQTLVATALEGAGTEAERRPGKQTLVGAELEAAGPLQRRAQAEAAGAAGGPPPSGGGGTPLPPDVRARMEAALGGNFGAVRVHQDGYAHVVGALAFTRGVDIFFAPGRLIRPARRGSS